MASTTGKRKESVMMFWYGNGMSGWGYALMTVGMVVFWGVLIVAVVVLVRSVGRSSSAGQRSAPEQVLAERFARGEIDQDEYRSRLATLRGHTPAPR